MTTTIASQSLARELQRRGYTAAQLGRLLAPEARRNGQYKAGLRLLDATHEIGVDRLGELAHLLGVRISFEPSGVVTIGEL